MRRAASSIGSEKSTSNPLGFRVLVENGGGQDPIAAAEVEEGADLLAARDGDELKHYLDLLDTEWDGAANVLQKLRNEIGILAVGRIFGHRGDHAR
ncbi:hypothetical protein CfE428DRAFT_5739 [Chthoniobacter flavus Ellin428]|uniref:Uncharacterized protein n=1 Tax=Chthoniobacter flavus Ellin428 TaxID=497964 RepID=B4D9W2_9BACT|nr:hypothetical protein [Chthoniobacter flavus]EDY16776.1 hypothetical protein CfE428DRAFT_5739 [Chthoniobacter flavus Ellin428]